MKAVISTLVSVAALAALPATSMASTAGCAPPRGPGDPLVHSANVRATNIDCHHARLVMLDCARFSYGHQGTCRAVSYRWYCRSHSLGGLSSTERCVAGRKAVSWIWLD
jgi:hypothetical protein